MSSEIPDSPYPAVVASDGGRVFLIDDNADIRSLLADEFRYAGLEVAEFPDGESFLKGTYEEKPSVIVVDMLLPGISGLRLFEAIRVQGVETPVIFISGYSQPTQIIDAMKLGAVDFLWKPFKVEALMGAVSKSLAQDAARINRLKRIKTTGKNWSELTRREQEICRLMVQGYGNSEISRQLDIQPDTVKKHRAKVLEKMGAESLADLMSFMRDIDVQ